MKAIIDEYQAKITTIVRMHSAALLVEDFRALIDRMIKAFSALETSYKDDITKNLADGDYCRVAEKTSEMVSNHVKVEFLQGILERLDFRASSSRKYDLVEIVNEMRDIKAHLFDRCVRLVSEGDKDPELQALARLFQLAVHDDLPAMLRTMERLIERNQVVYDEPAIDWTIWTEAGDAHYYGLKYTRISDSQTIDTAYVLLKNMLTDASYTRWASEGCPMRKAGSSDNEYPLPVKVWGVTGSTRRVSARTREQAWAQIKEDRYDHPDLMVLFAVDWYGGVPDALFMEQSDGQAE